MTMGLDESTLFRRSKDPIPHLRAVFSLFYSLAGIRVFFACLGGFLSLGGGGQQFMYFSRLTRGLAVFVPLF